MRREVKCEQCGSWTDGAEERCLICNSPLFERDKQEKEDLAKSQVGQLPLLEVDPNAPFWRRGMQQVIRFFQLLFFSLISLIGAIAGSAAH